MKATVKSLQNDIKFIERQIVNNDEAVNCNGLNKKRQDLSFLLQTLIMKFNGDYGVKEILQNLNKNKHWMI